VKLALAADHAGFELKERIRKDLESNSQVAILDLGAHVLTPTDDYPDYAERVGTSLVEGSVDRGIVVCGSGVGVCVALNKFPGVRAAVCHDTYSARQGVEHDDMNVLCLGARIVGVSLAGEIVRAFLDTKFSAEERHLRRLEKVIEFERRFLRGDGRNRPRN
jgi:ribose 5-phosphate isomerase B